MTTSGIVEEWRKGRERLISRLSEKDPANDVTIRMSTAFGRLSPEERIELEPLLRDWLLSDDFTERFDAIAIVRNNRVTPMIPTLRELQDRLEASTDVGAPYEWAKVNRALGTLVAAADSDPPDDTRELD